MRYPERQGLYDPTLEHDSCGVGFIVDMHNRASHDIIRQGLELIGNLDPKHYYRGWEDGLSAKNWRPLPPPPPKKKKAVKKKENDS